MTYWAAQDFASLEPYSPVKPLEVLAREIGVSVDDLAKLDANENLYGPLAEVCGTGDPARVRSPSTRFADPKRRRGSRLAYLPRPGPG